MLVNLRSPFWQSTPCTSLSIHMCSSLITLLGSSIRFLSSPNTHTHGTRCNRQTVLSLPQIRPTIHHFGTPLIVPLWPEHMMHDTWKGRLTRLLVLDCITRECTFYCHSALAPTNHSGLCVAPEPSVIGQIRLSLL